MTHHVAPAAASVADAPDGLDWESFSAASFPGRSRHDLEALTAYGAYRRSRAPEGRPSVGTAGIDPQRGRDDSVAQQNWENEGGAAA